MRVIDDLRGRLAAQALLQREDVTRVEVGLPGGWSDNNPASRQLRQKLNALPDKIENLSKLTPANA